MSLHQKERAFPILPLIVKDPCELQSARMPRALLQLIAATQTRHRDKHPACWCNQLQQLGVPWSTALRSKAVIRLASVECLKLPLSGLSFLPTLKESPDALSALFHPQAARTLRRCRPARPSGQPCRSRPPQSAYTEIRKVPCSFQKTVMRGMQLSAGGASTTSTE